MAGKKEIEKVKDDAITSREVTYENIRAREEPKKKKNKYQL